MSAKNGLYRFAMTMPSTRLRPPASVRACRLGLYFNCSTTRRTFARVELFTPGWPLSTRETVALPTPALLATSSRFMSFILWVDSDSRLHRVAGRNQAVCRYCVDGCALVGGRHNDRCMAGARAIPRWRHGVPLL